MHFCPECDYQADEGGRCPQCNLPLVSDEALPEDEIETLEPEEKT